MIHKPVVVRDVYIKVTSQYEGVVVVFCVIVTHCYIDVFCYAASGEIRYQVHCHDNGSVG